ncbi:MAG: hypothetical protein K1X36_14590 [Pyrinomonadaceae bacterium]|nr:hypothetical protein [Pyrinomonadaceae bacterium]
MRRSINNQMSQMIKQFIDFVLILALSATVVFAQKMRREKPIECRSKLTVHGKFRTAFVGSSGAGGLFVVDLIVIPENQTDENYLAIANQLKAKYCKEDYMAVSMYCKPPTISAS